MIAMKKIQLLPAREQVASVLREAILKRELKEGETAYFPYDSDNVTFSYSLKATNADGEESEPQRGTCTEVASGTVYTVTYEMETRSLSVAQ